MKKTVNPVGKFAKIWTVFQSINSYLVILCLVTEAYMQLRIFEFRMFQYSLDVVNVMDM